MECILARLIVRTEDKNVEMVGWHLRKLGNDGNWMVSRYRDSRRNISREDQAIVMKVMTVLLIKQISLLK